MTKLKIGRILFQVLLTYNNKDIHTATGMTPNDAKKPKIDYKSN